MSGTRTYLMRIIIQITNTLTLKSEVLIHRTDYIKTPEKQSSKTIISLDRMSFETKDLELAAYKLMGAKTSTYSKHYPMTCQRSNGNVH